MAYLNPLRSVEYGQSTLEDVSFASVTDHDVDFDIVKNYLRVTTTDDDGVIADLINDTVEQFEQMLNAGLSTRTTTATYSEYGREVTLPYGPVNSITSVKEIDNGVKSDIDSSEYYLTGDRLVLDSLNRAMDPFYKRGLEVIYDSGYSSIPSGLLGAIYQAIATNYVDREDNVLGGVTTIPTNSRKKALRYKRY